MKGNFSTECVFLLGAGASADAQIPISTRLNEVIRERLIREYPDPDDPHRRLLNYLVGAIFYHRGLSNRNPNASPVNIEEVISALRKLMNRDDEFVSVFVGSWSEKLREFSDAVLNQFDRQLTWWVAEELDNRKNPSSSAYLSWFADLYKEHTSTVNIFTLNHDLALELALKSSGIDYCTGFAPDADKRSTWHPDHYDGVGASQNSINIYKLHGSLGWTKNKETGEISSNSLFNASDMHLMIFGVLDKVTIEEPFFELTKRFKEKTRKASLIVSMGYSFIDDHINSIIFEATRISKNKRILVVDKYPEKILERLRKDSKRDINMSLISVVDNTGKGLKHVLENTDDLNVEIKEILDQVSESPF